MDFSKILEYQNKDGELFRIERGLAQNQSRKIYTEMINVVKKAQEKSSMLEAHAGNLSKTYEELKNAYDDNVKQMEKFINKDLDNANEKDLENIITATNSITNNLNILEKKLFTEAENLNITLNEFENAKKSYGQARAKYAEHKKNYDDEVQKIEPHISAIKADLSNLEKNIDAKLLARYKQLRADKVYPVFVKLEDRTCGGCRMEVSAVEVEKVKTQGYLECDHCHRIIIA